MVDRTIFNPATVALGKGLFSHAISVPADGSRFVFISGQVAWTPEGEVVGRDDFRVQFTRVYHNLQSLLEAAGGSMADIVQLRTYLTRRDDLPEFFRVRDELYPEIFPGGDYPTNTLLVVNALAEPDLLLEIEAIAALEDRRG